MAAGGVSGWQEIRAPELPSCSAHLMSIGPGAPGLGFAADPAGYPAHCWDSPRRGACPTPTQSCKAHRGGKGGSHTSLSGSSGKPQPLPLP